MRKKLCMLFCVFTTLLCALPVTAGADVGPKDEATICLTNLPEGSYLPNSKISRMTERRLPRAYIL